MSIQFKNKDQFIKYLSRYEIADITKQLKETNARSFITSENLAEILEKVPQERLDNFIRSFIKVDSLDGALDLIEGKLLGNIPQIKIWHFFVASLPVPLQMVTADNLSRINTLFSDFPDFAAFRFESKNFHSFSIESGDDARSIILFLTNKLQIASSLLNIIEKCQQANPEATASFFYSPLAICSCLDKIREQRAKPGVTTFLWGQLKDKTLFIKQALSSQDEFDSFIKLLTLVDQNQREKYLTELYAFQDEEISAEQLDKLRPFISISSQYMKENSIRLYQQGLLSSQKFFDYLSTLREESQVTASIVELSNEKQLELFDYAEGYFNRIHPSYELMKQYQYYQAICFFLISHAIVTISICENDDGEGVFALGLILTIPIDLVILALGLIPALIGLCLMCSRLSAEHLFQESVQPDNPENHIELSDLSARYLSAYSFWNGEKMVNYSKTLSVLNQPIVLVVEDDDSLYAP